MEFFKCSIGGEVYGTGVTEIEKGIAQRNGLKVEVYIAVIFWGLTLFLFKQKITLMSLNCYRSRIQTMRCMRRVLILMMLGLCGELGEMSPTLMLAR